MREYLVHSPSQQSIATIDHSIEIGISRDLIEIHFLYSKVMKDSSQ